MGTKTSLLCKKWQEKIKSTQKIHLLRISNLETAHCCIFADRVSLDNTCTIKNGNNFFRKKETG